MGGYISTIKLRRIILAALYDKVIKLSMKSMTMTNSGKLISLISGDLSQVERGLSFSPLVLASPFINLTAYILLAQMIGIKYTMIAFGFWVLMLIV